MLTPRSAAKRRLAVFEFALGLPAQEIADAAVDVRRFAGDAEKPFAIVAAIRPDSAALAAPMRNAMGDAAERNHHAVRKWHGLRQPAEPRGDPAAMLLRELARFLQGSARRHREDHLAGGRLNAQSIAARLAMPPQPHKVDRLVEDHLNGLRLARPTIEQCAL